MKTEGCRASSALAKKHRQMKRQIATLCLTTMAMTSAMAGGILTNTNQNVAFLRNPCRDAAVAIDGVYSNPAGVAFLPSGLHLSLNIQSAYQTRTITSTFGAFAYGIDNGGKSSKTFEGEANAPVVPSVQLAYNKNRWSFQFGFAVTGGGGKCTFEDGLGSFESVVSLIPMLASAKGLDVRGYDYESYLKGRQYYFGAQFGSAFKVNDWLSVYGGIRLTYGTSNYNGYLRNIEVATGTDVMLASSYFQGLCTQATEAAVLYGQAAQQYATAGLADKAAEALAAAEQYKASAMTTGAMAMATRDVTLNCDQTGFGIAPTIGVHARMGNFDFAAKYDFRTRMELENVSANSESAENLDALRKFANGNTVREDGAALLTLGAAWQVIEPVRVMVGWHHFFDKDAKQYGNKQELLDGGTDEFTAGAEWDITKKLQVSGGVQITRYPFTDAYMNDMSFSVDSWTFGCGVGYQLTDKVKLNLAYFQTNYSDYTKQTNDFNGLSAMIGKLTNEATAQALVQSGKLSGTDVFSRTNRVFGIGIDFKF